MENEIKVTNEVLEKKDESLQDLLSKNTALSSKLKVMEEDLEEMKNEEDRKAAMLKKMKTGASDAQWSAMLASNGVPESGRVSPHRHVQHHTDNFYDENIVENE